MAASDRRQLQQQLKEPDPFFEALLEAREYFDNNRSQVITIAVAVVAAFAVVVGISSYWVSQGRSAATNFSNAVSSLESNSTTAAQADLEKIGSLSNTGPYAALASLYQADIHAQAGEYEQAVLGYDQFLKAPPTVYLEQVGLMGKAAALEKSGKGAEASAALDKAGSIDGPYRKAALSDRARLAEKSGDKATAIASLQKLLELEGSTGDPTLERRIQSLKESAPAPK
ncbi:MAG TPA: tetratricopeptide repeat protein [Candidatus Binatia bacterium]|jgi:hypothetical protein